MPRVIVAVAGFAALAFAFAAQASADEGWTIQRFGSDITVQKDSSLHIVEAIDVDFGSQQHHGIFRNIPFRDRWDDTHLRVYRLEVRSVIAPAENPARFSISAAGAANVIRFVDANRPWTGPQSSR